jgi:hypothetical protein
MALPKRPELKDAIPNDTFSSPEQTAIKGPYWYMTLGSGLESDGEGSIQISGSTSSSPTAMVYGPNGYVGLGTGLVLNNEGNIVVD